MADLRPRIKLDRTTVRAGEAVGVKTLVSHVMETGLRRDADGRLIPRMIINTFTCDLNGHFVFGCDLDRAVSANPFFEFKFRPWESGTLTFTWSDDEGTRITATAAVTVV